MPIVPKNTISEPVRVRRPGINMAEPRTAQAMGAVTSALGRRASSIGRLGDLAGVSARQTAEMGNQQMKILQANASAEQAKWNTLEKLGGQMINFGFRLDAIQERRAREDARNAITEFTLAADPIVFGRVDPESGERIPGTLETPYAPGDKENQPNSPSIATAKAFKELLDSDDTPWGKLDHRSRKVFDQEFVRLQQQYMRQAIKADGDQIMTLRQVNEKRAVDAFLEHVGSIGEGIDPTSKANWLQSVSDGITHIVMGQVGQYYDEAKGEWVNPQAKQYAEDTRKDLLEAALATRVGNWLKLADETTDPQAREELLANAEAYAEMQDGNSPILTELARAKVKSDAQNVRVRAEQRFHAENLREFQKTKEQYYDVAFGRAQMTPELQQRLDRLPKEQRFSMEADVYALNSKIEEGHFAIAYDRWLAERNPDNNETGRQFLEQMILSMTSPTAKLKATAMLEKVDAAEETARNQAEVLLQNETAFKMERMIDMGGYIDASGAYVPMTDAQMASMILDPRITPEKAVALQEKARKKWKREDHEYAKQAVEFARNKFGVDELAEAFSVKDGIVTLAEGVDPDDTYKFSHEVYLDTPVYGWNDPSAALYNWWNEKDGKYRHITVLHLRADLIRDMVQAAVDYGQQTKTLSRSGTPPPSLDEVLNGIFIGPKGQMYQTEVIASNIQDMVQMIRNMDYEARRRAFKAFSEFPVQDYRQLVPPVTIED